MIRFLFLIALLAVLVLGAVLLYRTVRQAVSRPPAVDPNDPKEILRRRYAAGEIDEDEYLRRMSGLSQDW